MFDRGDQTTLAPTPAISATSLALMPTAWMTAVFDVMRPRELSPQMISFSATRSMPSPKWGA